MSGCVGIPPGPSAEAPGPPLSVAGISRPPGPVTGPLEGSCFEEGSVGIGFSKPGPLIVSTVVSGSVSSCWLSVGSWDEGSSAVSLPVVSAGSGAGSSVGVASFAAVVWMGAGAAVGAGSWRVFC